MASNTVIQILRSYSNVAPTTLADGELAYSFLANALYIGSNTGQVILIGGASFAQNVTVNLANTSIETLNADGGEF
jgi:hypothetical protein